MRVRASIKASNTKNIKEANVGCSTFIEDLPKKSNAWLVFQFKGNFSGLPLPGNFIIRKEVSGRSHSDRHLCRRRFKGMTRIVILL